MNIMTPQDQVRTLSEKIVANLCSITAYPDSWLPHTVWVEEESTSTGDPTYRHYMLESIHPDGTCTLHNPATGKLEHDAYSLHDINIDWLIIVWNRYTELCITQQIWEERAFRILRTHTGAADATIREFVQKHWQHQILDQDNIAAFSNQLVSKDNVSSNQPYAFIWSYHFADRSISDEELIEAWQNGPSHSKYEEDDEELYEIERLTPDELAERINDDSYAYTEDYVRFIHMGKTE